MIRIQRFNLNQSLLVIITMILISCGGNKINIIDEYMLSYSDIQHKKIAFPEHLSIINKCYLPKDFQLPKMKIICTGQMGCSPCVIKLKEIEKYVNENKELINKVIILYIASGEFNEYFDYQVKENNFSFPIFHDINRTFITNNGLDDYEKEVFLLDENNKIIFVGSPFNDRRLHKYYKKLILNEN